MSATQKGQAASIHSTATIPIAYRVRSQKLLRAWARSAVVLLLLLFGVDIWYNGQLHHWGMGLIGCGGGHKHRPKGRILVGKEAEKVFLSVPDEASALAASRKYAAEPHLAGSPRDLETAKEFLSHLQTELRIPSSPIHLPIFQAGSHESRTATLSIPQTTSPRAWIDVYYPVLNTPLDRSVQILGEDGNAVWTADLEERSDDMDPEAAKYAEAVPAFHGLSKGGEVEGKLVYANYGNQEDYDGLLAKGVDLKGKIVIVRYGGIFRGLKIKGAQERGAVGVLIYSDLRDDGTVTPRNGYAPYPAGPARNPTSVQRGSVQFISTYPGDPTTPGYPSYENSTRSEGTNIPRIPSLPISSATAEVLLKEIGENGLGRTIRLVNHVDFKVTPIWNTLGVIPGHIRDQVVVIGNHRDAWVMGASDPSSGTTSFHEVIRGLGALTRKGWKPLRTIVIASWDAEEYGLIGSTEWGEDFSEFIDRHAVAYLNLDSSVCGARLVTSASPSLAHLVRSTANEIAHPTRENATLWDARSDRGILFGKHVDPEDAPMYDKESKASDIVGVQPLGSGSDYTVFLQRIGVASIHGGFKSTLSDPVFHYHSVFDSQRWQELYGDPGFVRHVAVAKHVGLQTLRLASSIILPFNTTHYSLELEAYLQEVQHIASAKSLDIDLTALQNAIYSLQNASAKLDVEKLEAETELKKFIERLVTRRRSCRFRQLARNVIHKIKGLFGKDYSCAQQRHGDQSAIPAPLNLVDGRPTAIKPRIGRYPGWLQEQEQQMDYGFAIEAGGGDPFSLDADSNLSVLPLQFPFGKFKHLVKRVQAVNRKLVAFERGFISERGINDREWYKHLGVAPGKWLGYGATTLPALTEALTIDNNVTAAVYEASRLTDLIRKLSDNLRP